MADLNSGDMPNSDGRYEDFEGLIGSYYKSLLPLKESAFTEDGVDFEKIERALKRICERHKIQSPEYCLKCPRTQEEWANPKDLTTEGLMKSQIAFVHFGLNKETGDHQDLYIIGQTIALILTRHNVADIEYRERLDGSVEATKVHKWNRPLNYKTLKDIIPRKKEKPKIIVPG